MAPSLPHPATPCRLHRNSYGANVGHGLARVLRGGMGVAAPRRGPQYIASTAHRKGSCEPQRAVAVSSLGRVAPARRSTDTLTHPVFESARRLDTHTFSCIPITGGVRRGIVLGVVLGEDEGLRFTEEARWFSVASCGSAPSRSEASFFSLARRRAHLRPRRQGALPVSRSWHRGLLSRESPSGWTGRYLAARRSFM